jgi:hypothetical protein
VRRGPGPAWAVLYDEGIYVVGFFFPVVAEGQARIRTQLSAAHEQAHLDRAIEALTFEPRLATASTTSPTVSFGFR